MHDTLITFQGNLGGEVAVRRAGDAEVATFRVASTPRRFDRKTETWVDGVTQWYSVSAWRALGRHCAESLRRGEPVFVHGRLRAQTWVTSAGAEVTSYDVDAFVVGHDLSRGKTVFHRPARGAAAPAPADPGEPDETDQPEPPAGVVPAA